jgi:hypothetical protein
MAGSVIQESYRSPFNESMEWFVGDNYMRYPERRGDPPGRPYRGKGLFTGCARGFLRNNEGQFEEWEKEAEIRG